MCVISGDVDCTETAFPNFSTTKLRGTTEDKIIQCGEALFSKSLLYGIVITGNLTCTWGNDDAT